MTNVAQNRVFYKPTAFERNANVESYPAGPFIEELPPKKSKKHGNQYQRLLKSKENAIKAKCNKALKNKLKKYKLRKDGAEDPDVLDISLSFKQYLKLRSPSQLNIINGVDSEIESTSNVTKPKNYLSKMAKKKCLSEVKNHETNDKSVLKPKTNDNSITSLAKKPTNAFQFMMDSRNKSIGCNSPGKEQMPNELEENEFVEKRKSKVKRNLALQRLSEAKGSIKKKEIEEQRDVYISLKMEKRAKRLKGMIFNDTKKKKVKEHMQQSGTVKVENNIMSHDTIESSTVTVDKKTDANLTDIILQNRKKMLSSKNKTSNNDDEDFLKKLSPTLRKKENMLSYFQKVEKEPLAENLLNGNRESNVKNKCFKEKLLSKKKKKDEISNKKITDESTDIIISEDKPVPEICDFIDSDDTNQKLDTVRKRKRKNMNERYSDINSSLNTCNSRPKRNTKKPMKYIDDIEITSSDDDLYIFTPKKKKNTDIEVNIKLEGNTNNKRKSEQNTKNTNTKVRSKNTTPKNSKESTKLAPIFMAKSSVDTVTHEAKLKFLQSGIPDQLKKVVSLQKAHNLNMSSFYPVMHVQQNSSIENNSSSNFCSNALVYETVSKIHKDIKLTKLKFKENDAKQLLCLKKTKEMKHKNAIENIGANLILKCIKEGYPEFPVYRIFNALNNRVKDEHNNFYHTDFDNSSELVNGMIDIRSEDPKSLSWCDKYKASSSKQVIGNFDSMKELQKWLVSWAENDARHQQDKSDSDSDFRQSDTDSRDSMKSSNNLLVITGPVGSGKTSSVYAVAAELAIKVIEVNVSSKRSGKLLLQDLQEATQSHKVNRGKGSSTENSQNSQDILRIKGVNSVQKQSKQKNKFCSKVGTYNLKGDTLSQSQNLEDGRTAMSLILIDDADVVFEQDDGFVSAIAHLVQCSKRPVVLVTSSMSCQHLQKLLPLGHTIKMNPLSPKILGTWLDIMCLADTGVCWPGVGSKILDYYDGDIRKTINCLHFNVTSEVLRYSKKDNSDGIIEEKLDNFSTEDENSNVFWEHPDNVDDNGSSDSCFNSKSPSSVWRRFVGIPNRKMHLVYPLELLNVWWRIPCMINYKQINEIVAAEPTLKKQQELDVLQNIADIIDCISFADCMSFKTSPNANSDILSKPWYCAETNSVSEKENYDVKSDVELSNDISYALVKSSLEIVKKANWIQRIHIDFPGMSKLRVRNKTVSRHEVLSNAISPSSQLDRRGVALDYWSSCRTICRIEKEKVDNNSKRNNRFCHYLKSAKVMCKNDVFDKLCDSLKSGE